MTHIDWLRAAVQEGLDDLERGDYITLRSEQEIKNLMRQLREEALTKIAGSPPST